MADLSQRERLQPSLLDRLTDEDPSKSKETREARALSLKDLRNAVLRDLTWLFNCIHLAATDDLEKYPEVQVSVANYGIPDLGGFDAEGTDSIQMERDLRDVILRFEPRILPDTLQVRVLSNEYRRDGNSVAFEIEGELWAHPLPQRLYLQTELDLQGGEPMVSDYDRLGTGAA